MIGIGKSRIVRMGGGAGFWGDSPEGARQLILSGEVDYVILDYLAEITMSLLARARAKDPSGGYVPDFITDVIAPFGDEIAKRGLKIIASAGGVNPRACKEAVEAELRRQGSDLKVAAVLGDDASGLMDDLRRSGVRDMAGDAELPAKVNSANAYTGAIAIAKALELGASIVVTGRVADSALAVGPLMHEFGWRPDQFDLLAAGSLAGHVIECGPQSTGGVFTDWRKVADGWDTIGYPIVSCRADGTFVVSKPAGTGGLVSRATVSEQICYEVGDPANYVLPDVVCDLRQVRVTELGEDRVEVSGVRGKAPTGTYKVSATYQDGFRSIATLMINGPEAVHKARAVGDAILRRVRRIADREGLGPFADTSIEVLGGEHNYGPHARSANNREVILKVGVRHAKKRAVDIFSREIAPATTSMGQGSAGVMGGRPKVQPVLRLVSVLVDKSRLRMSVLLGKDEIEVDVPTEGQSVQAPAPDAHVDMAAPPGDGVSVPLIRLAYGRSGDKGNDSNIAVIARDPAFLAVIDQQLTAAAVRGYMEHIVEGEVERYRWPGVGGFNFLLRRSLGGGGIASLRYDPQGKAHAQMLMDFPITIPATWLRDGVVAPDRAP